jgi:hypothetical protein
MSEERHEKLTIEEIKQRLRTGYTFHPTQPGLQQAAREVIRPVVEKMDGHEIIYECRVHWLMRVAYLEVNDDGFRAVGTHVHDLGDRIMTLDGKPREPKPLDFGGHWNFLRMRGSAICMNMITDCFYPDPEVVAEVKAAVARNATREISGILERASCTR